MNRAEMAYISGMMDSMKESWESSFRRPARITSYDVQVYKHRAQRKAKKRMAKASKRGNR